MIDLYIGIKALSAHTLYTDGARMPVVKLVIPAIKYNTDSTTNIFFIF